MRCTPFRSLSARPLLAAGFFLLFRLLCAPPAGAEWKVTPIRLELDRQAKTGIVTVTNEGDEPMQLQLKAMEWSQDGEGKDRYAETQELVFFPKIMELGKREARIVRVGVRVPASRVEKTFRLFVEEIPRPRKREGSNVTIAIRFGLPVFVRPAQAEPKGWIRGAELSDGTLGAVVENRGNVHLFVQSVVLDGTDAGGQTLFSKEINGWYLLAGASRRYSAEVPGSECKRIATFAISVKTDRFPLEATVPGDPSRCGADADGGPPR